MALQSTESRTSVRGDLGRLALIILIAVSVRAWVIAHTEVPSRDCLIFVRYALHLEDPPTHPFNPQQQLSDYVEVIKVGEHPPGYPAAILGMSHLLRGLGEAVTADTMTLSAQLVSALSALLLIFPAYFLVKRLFDATTAFASVLMFQVLPVYAEVTSDGISDGLFLLTAVTALWFAVISLDRLSSRSSFLAGIGVGLCCGLGYLIRPDAMIVVGAVGLTYAVTSLTRRINKLPWLPPFVAGLGLLVGLSLTMGPYVKLIGKLTNKRTGQGLIDGMQGGDVEKTYFERDSRLPNITLPMAAWWDPNTHSNQKLWGAKVLFQEYTKAAHYIVPIFTLIGLIAYRRKLMDARYALLLFLMVLHLAVLYYMASRIGYVSQRHTLLDVFLSCIWAGAALPIVGGWGWRWTNRLSPWGWGFVWLAIILAASLPRDFRVLHGERSGHREAGYWLEANAPAESKIIDPYGWTEFYSGRTLRGWTTATKPDVRGQEVYSLVEPNAKSSHSRLPFLDVAKDLAKKGEKVYQFPPDAPPEKVRVEVYRTVPLKPKGK